MYASVYGSIFAKFYLTFKPASPRFWHNFCKVLPHISTRIPAFLARFLQSFASHFKPASPHFWHDFCKVLPHISTRIPAFLARFLQSFTSHFKPASQFFPPLIVMLLHTSI